MDFFFEGLRKQLVVNASGVDLQQAITSQAEELKEKAHEKEVEKAKKVEKDFQERELSLKQEYDGKMAELQAENEQLKLKLKSENARLENDIKEMQMLVHNKDILIEKLTEERQDLQRHLLSANSPRSAIIKQPIFHKSPTDLRKTNEDEILHAKKGKYTPRKIQNKKEHSDEDELNDPRATKTLPPINIKPITGM